MPRCFLAKKSLNNNDDLALFDTTIKSEKWSEDEDDDVGLNHHMSQVGSISAAKAVQSIQQPVQSIQQPVQSIQQPVGNNNDTVLNLSKRVVHIKQEAEQEQAQGKGNLF